MAVRWKRSELNFKVWSCFLNSAHHRHVAHLQSWLWAPGDCSSFPRCVTACSFEAPPTDDARCLSIECLCAVGCGVGCLWGTACTLVLRAALYLSPTAAWVVSLAQGVNNNRRLSYFRSDQQPTCPFSVLQFGNIHSVLKIKYFCVMLLKHFKVLRLSLSFCTKFWSLSQSPCTAMPFNETAA